MKKTLFSCFFLCFVCIAYSQNDTGFTAITGKLLRITPRLNDVDKNSVYGQPFIPQRDINGLIGEDEENEEAGERRNYGSNDPHTDPLLALQSANGVATASAIINANFEGLNNPAITPGDPTCAVGPNHIIQAINGINSTIFRIWDKNGILVQPTMMLSSLTGVQGAGDPTILYDQLAHRWLINEFGKVPAVSPNNANKPNTLIIAISVTDDPLGSWYIYAFTDNSFFCDYPKFAIWHNAYYATTNDITNNLTSGNTYIGSSIYAFNRTQMLAGNPTTTAIRRRFTDPADRYYSLAPVSCEGNAFPIQTGTFVFYQDNQFTAPFADADSIFIFQFSPNFSIPALSTISAFTKMVATAFDSEVCTATLGQCISQQGSAIMLEDITGKTMNKVVYRNFGDHEAIVMNFTVNVGLLTPKAGIRWNELRRTGGAWSLFQEGTYSPDAQHRWMGAIGIDAVGNIGLTYNVSGSSTFPSIRFTGRNPCDAVGVMSLPETVIWAGTAASAFNRYGDYGSLSVDPANGRDFWLTEQYNKSANFSTRVASFTLNNCDLQPKIRFQSAALSLYESNANINLPGCQRYKDYTVNVVADAAPSQPATITFSTAGTATNAADKDYIIFPASVTLDAANLSKPVTIRVFDDAITEAPETFSITYTINNGGGNAVADSYNQTCFATIIDNDGPPTYDTTLIGRLGDFYKSIPNNSVTSPFEGTTNTDKRVQYFYAAAELRAAGLKPGNITELKWDVNSGEGTFNNFTAQIGFTTGDLAAGNFITPASGFTTVFSGTMIIPVNAANIALPMSVNWNGTDNIIIQTCFDNNATTITNTFLRCTDMATYTASVYKTINAASTNICSAATVTGTSTIRPDITLKIVSPVNPVATALNTSSSEYLGPNDDVYFYDNTGKIMARIKNLTAFDYGCTQVQIDRDGVGSLPFWSNNFMNNLAQKSFKVIPANNTTSGHYQITLYYSLDEVHGWQQGTTQSWGNAQVVKVSNGFYIPDVTVATPHVADVMIVPGVFGMYNTQYTITGDFNNTGFSGFGTGIPGLAPLPVTLIYFTGYNKDGFAQLEWKTASEINSKGFEIEKSFDGVNFLKIGFVQAAGTTSLSKNYSFADKESLTDVQYYRLRQIDLDGRAVYSNIVVLRSAISLLDILSVTNPFNKQIDMLFTKPVKERMTVTLFDAAGRKVFSTNITNTSSNVVSFEVTNKITPGIYLLKATVGELQFTRKLVKQ